MTAPHFMVTGANGDVGEAVGRILRETYPAASLTGTDSGGSWPGELAFDRMIALPRADEPNYPDALRAAFETAGADLIIPCSDAEQSRIADQAGARDGLPILAAQAALVGPFCDKLQTAEWLAAHGIPVARTAPAAAATAEWLPAIVKPRAGQGSKNLHVVRSVAHLGDVLAALDGDVDDYVVQAFLDDSGGEFTCALLGWNGDARTLIMRRTLMGGLTARATVVADPAIQDLLDRLLGATELAGPINVQLRVTRHGPVVFEINPRFSSTVMMRHRVGFRDLVWAVEAWLHGTPLPPFDPPVGARMARLSREAVLQ